MLACDLHDYGSPAGEREDILDDWNLSSVDLSKDTRLVLSPAGEVVGYAILIDEREGIELQALSMVHPEHRGFGVEEMLLSRIGERAAEMNAGRGGVIRYWWGTSDEEAERLASFGYRRARTIRRMDADVAAITPRSLDGIVVRAFDPERDAVAVHDVMEDAFSAHYGWTPTPFEEWKTQWIEREGFDPGLSFVAESGGEIVGAALNVERLGMGWVADLGVREGRRRQGIGAALVEHSMAGFHRRGYRQAGLNVDPENETGAMRLYEKLGFRSNRDFAVYEKQLMAAGSTTA
jgi:mycothiol synthase